MRDAETAAGPIRPTGISNLDRILPGGVPAGHVVLVSGDSGTGKTILCMEWLFKGYTDHGESGLYLTLTEPITQAAANVESMDFYDDGAHGEGVHFTDLRTTLDLLEVEPGEIDRDDVEDILSAITEVIERTGAKRVVLDSITALAYMLREKDLIRYFIFRLGATLDNLDCTTFLTSEVREDAYSVYGVEEFISDAIIKLRQMPMNNDLQRSLQVIKMRGVDYESASFTFNISTSGIDLHYHESSLTYPSPETRVSIGVPGLDRMCGGGVFDTSMTMVAGPAGTGKTLMSIHFLQDGLENGEKCLYVGFEESQEQLLRNARYFGCDLEPFLDEGTLQLCVSYPDSRFPSQHLEAIKTAVNTHNIDRIAIDPISAINNVYSSEAYGPFNRQAARFLKNNGVTGIVTVSTSELMGTQQLSQSSLSTLTDNIFLLKYAETAGELSRVISILKTRGTNHDNQLRQYRITSNGLDIGEPVRAFEGVFSGTARKVGQTVDEQLQALFVETFGPMGEDEYEQFKETGVDEQQLSMYVDDLVQQGILTMQEGDQFRRQARRILNGNSSGEPAEQPDDAETAAETGNTRHWWNRLLG